jgi:hypothetical protein
MHAKFDIGLRPLIYLQTQLQRNNSVSMSASQAYKPRPRTELCTQSTAAQQITMSKSLIIDKNKNEFLTSRNDKMFLICRSIALGS